MHIRILMPPSLKECILGAPGLTLSSSIVHATAGICVHAIVNLRSLVLLAVAVLPIENAIAGVEFVRLAADEKGFVLAHSHKPFIPWGHNYAVN